MAEAAETPEPESDELPTPVSAAAIALALGQRGQGRPELDADAAAFLREHTRMLQLQMEHLHEQRILNLKHLQWRLFGDRVKGALQAMSLVVGAAIIIGIGAMVWEARQEHGLLVEAFAVPPDLAQKGLTGQVMANLIVDRIIALDAKAQSVRAASSYKENWGQDIKVEIPETGISLGELRRFLRESLGADTRIAGEAFHGPAGLTLSVRAGASPAITTEGPETELTALVTHLAEGLYAVTQPYRYSKYLEAERRFAEALTVARQLSFAGDATERAWAFAQISNLLEIQGDEAPALEAARQALRLDPDLALGAINAKVAEQALGHDEEALGYMRQAKTLLENSGEDVSPGARAIYPIVNEAAMADLTGDHAAARADYQRIEQRPDFQGLVALAIGERAYEQAKDHDVTGSRDTRMRATSPDIDVVDVAQFQNTNDAIIPEYFEAVDVGDWDAALADLDRAIAATAATGPIGAIERWRFLEPRRAYVLARLGRQPEADAAIAATPLDCYLCVLMRGKVAAQGGQWAAAAQDFALALRMAPSLPFAETDHGEMLLAKGDVAGAAEMLARAHEKSPHFADPLELWGEALARKGDLDAALAKFRAAAQAAPNWGRLHLQWGLALDRLGRRSEAVAQFGLARSLDLSPADRQTLAGRRPRA